MLFALSCLCWQLTRSFDPIWSLHRPVHSHGVEFYRCSRRSEGPQAPRQRGRVVRLLNLELFILGIKTIKLHFCYLELILNKTGYSHITENNFFHFLTWELIEKKLTPYFFRIFSGTRQNVLGENKVYLKASICDVLMVE